MHKGTRGGVNKKEGSADKTTMADNDSTPEQSPVGSVGGTTRKRKRQDPVSGGIVNGRKGRINYSPHLFHINGAGQSELCQQLYDSIRNVKKDDGTMLCDTFIRAPKRRQEPSYYEVVTNPIDLLRVQQKLKTESYDDVDDLSTDFELLVKNAKAFYKPTSAEHADACLLWSTFCANKAKLLEAHPDLGGGGGGGNGGSGVLDETAGRPKRIGRQRKSAATNDDDAASETSSSKAEDDAEWFEELFATVMLVRDESNRPLHAEFLLLPSKKLYSDYYDIIDHPIDLKFIATKIQTSAYTSLNDMEKDLLQMTKNACTFNEPGSQIYKDAKTLKRIIGARKLELESGKWRGTPKPRRKVLLSVAATAVKEPLDESDDENDEQMDTDGDDGPLWQLFDQLYNSANSSGAYFFWWRLCVGSIVFCVGTSGIRDRCPCSFAIFCFVHFHYCRFRSSQHLTHHRSPSLRHTFVVVCSVVSLCVLRCLSVVVSCCHPTSARVCDTF